MAATVCFHLCAVNCPNSRHLTSALTPVQEDCMTMQPCSMLCTLMMHTSRCILLKMHAQNSNMHPAHALCDFVCIRPQQDKEVADPPCGKPELKAGPGSNKPTKPQQRHAVNLSLALPGARTQLQQVRAKPNPPCGRRSCRHVAL